MGSRVVSEDHNGFSPQVTEDLLQEHANLKSTGCAFMEAEICFAARGDAGYH